MTPESTVKSEKSQLCSGLFMQLTLRTSGHQSCVEAREVLALVRRIACGVSDCDGGMKWCSPLVSQAH